MNIKPEVLREIRELIRDKIKNVEICIDGVWHPGTIHKKEIEDEVVTVTASFGSLDSSGFIISSVRITDESGNTVAEHIQNYSKSTGNGMFIYIKIPIREV